MKVESNNIITTQNDKIDTKNIQPQEALKMLSEGLVNKSTISISDSGIVTFKDQQNNSYKAELTKEQISIFSSAANQDKVTDTKSIKADQISLKNEKSGSAMSKAKLFEDDAPAVTNLKNKPKDDTWKFKFDFAFNRTKYFDTDMHLKSSRVDVTVKDFSFEERTSADFYNPKTWKQPMDALRWIDEPTNSFSISAEKNNNVFSITAFHPKFLKQQYETKHVTGTIDGVAVDKVMPINEPFDGYNAQPGEMNLVRFESTHRQMDWQIGYGRNITLIDGDKFGKLVYRPSVQVGITTGQHVDVYKKPNQYWEFDNYEDKHRIQGGNVTFGNRLEYDYKKVGLFIENKTTFSHLEHQFMDGTAKYNMGYNYTGVGLSFQVAQTKPKK